MGKGKKFSPGRRHLLIGSAGLTALSIMPAVAGSVLTAPARQTRLQAWVRRFDAIDANPAVPSGPLKLVLRGPYAPASTVPRVTVGAIYRALPTQPFALFDGSGAAADPGVVLHLEPGALTGLHLGLADEPADCGLDCPLQNLFDSVLQPGRVAVLINTGRWRLRPDWSVLRVSDKAVEPDPAVAVARWADLQFLSLNVSPA